MVHYNTTVYIVVYNSHNTSLVDSTIILLASSTKFLSSATLRPTPSPLTHVRLSAHHGMNKHKWNYASFFQQKKVKTQHCTMIYSLLFHKLLVNNLWSNNKYPSINTIALCRLKNHSSSSKLNEEEYIFKVNGRRPIF